jgi:hypothetical protein
MHARLPVWHSLLGDTTKRARFYAICTIATAYLAVAQAGGAAGLPVSGEILSNRIDRAATEHCPGMLKNPRPAARSDRSRAAMAPARYG